MHCVILGAISPCHAGSLGPTLPVDCRLGSQTTQTTLPSSLPRGGHDFLSALFVLKQSGVKIKPPRGTVGQCPLHPASLPSVALRSLSGLPPIWIGR